MNREKKDYSFRSYMRRLRGMAGDPQGLDRVLNDAEQNGILTAEEYERLVMEAERLGL